MATHNGGRFLGEQLQSLCGQTHSDWSLWCSDDASSDETRDVLDDFRGQNPQRDIRVFEGPGKGSAANFLSLLDRPGATSGAIALSDQDDVWMPDRLERALSCFQAAPAAPNGRVYASRTILTDANLNPQIESRRHMRPPSFGNALVQNILAGNTIVADSNAAALLGRTASAAYVSAHVAHHDWWIYLLASGAGTEILIDDRPGVFYRQHSSNTMAAHRGVRQGLKRMQLILNGEYASWIDQNLSALDACREELTSVNQGLLDSFSEWRNGTHRFGRPLPKNLGVHRQTRSGNALLSLMALGKLV